MQQALSLCSLALTMSLLAIGSSARAAVVIWTGDATWATSAGGNGHRYEAVLLDSVITWTDARDIALSRGGHLATITSAAENSFVFSSLASNPSLWDSSPSPMADGPYLGGFHSGAAGETWQWVTGETWDFTAWAPGEPNGVPGGPQGLSYWNPAGPSPTWFDHPPSDPTTRSLIVEYPIPSPSALALLSLTGIASRRRRS